MPEKKQRKKKTSQKGKKGGQASRTKTNVSNDVDYFEIDEFTLDDITNSKS